LPDLPAPRPAGFRAVPGRALRLPGRAGGWVLRRWRRSMQLRVVLTTLLASAIVVALLGVVLLHQITDGLLAAKRQAAIGETNSGLEYARSQLSAVSGQHDPQLQQTVLNVARTLQSRGGSAGLYDVWILPATANLEAVTPLDQRGSTIPDALRQMVRLGAEGYAYTQIQTFGAAPAAGFVVGAPVSSPAGLFELYYVFPLAVEIQTIRFVQRALLIAGGVLMLLLAGVAALVTRQVVTPVRLAARTAERLAAGVLTERMRVPGEDDLARLAVSFNTMADSLSKQIVRLGELSRLQQRFTSDVSHELRTPLTTVRMAADVLHAARGDFAPEVARSAELLQAEVGRFEELLVDLLEISRYDAGFARLDAEPTDLRTIVGRAVDAVRPLAERAGSPLLLDLPDLPLIAEVDPRRVERILRNLLANAADHGAGHPIEIRMAGSADAAAVTIRDHGVGLRPGEAALVFSRFWRADPSRARTSGGTGLGLAISLEDARLHGGWLQAWGEPGAGALFRLTLPRQPGAQLAGSPLALEPPDAAGGRPGAAVPSPVLKAR